MDTEKVDPASLALLTFQTRALLACHRELGITAYPADPLLRRVFTGVPVRQPVRDEPRVRPLRDTVPQKNAETKPRQNDDLAAIARDIAACRNCDPGPGQVLPGLGDEQPKLVVIGDYCSASTNGEIWGAQEDEMFWKMMAAIGLDRNSVYVTNCVKCAVDEENSRDRIKRCREFLERELAVLKPELICTMGLAAAQLLLAGNQPLHRLRGRFHQYSLSCGGSARVMPTYHPRFLLKQPEMKRVAWLDLQTIQRRLTKNP